jgi:hypothetical protein
VSTASPPSAGATLHSGFGAAGEARQAAIAAPINIFSMNASAMASPGFCGPLGPYPPGAADTRRLPTQNAVKRKLQATRPFPQPLPRRARPHADYHGQRMEVVQALSPGQVTEARSLFREYERSLGILRAAARTATARTRRGRPRRLRGATPARRRRV